MRFRQAQRRTTTGSAEVLDHDRRAQGGAGGGTRRGPAGEGVPGGDRGHRARSARPPAHEGEHRPSAHRHRCGLGRRRARSSGCSCCRSAVRPRGRAGHDGRGAGGPHRAAGQVREGGQGLRGAQGDQLRHVAGGRRGCGHPQGSRDLARPERRRAPPRGGGVRRRARQRRRRRRHAAVLPRAAGRRPHGGRRQRDLERRHLDRLPRRGGRVPPRGRRAARPRAGTGAGGVRRRAHRCGAAAGHAGRPVRGRRTGARAARVRPVRGPAGAGRAAAGPTGRARGGPLEPREARGDPVASARRDVRRLDLRRLLRAPAWG